MASPRSLSAAQHSRKDSAPSIKKAKSIVVQATRATHIRIMSEKRPSISREAVLAQLHEIAELAFAELRRRGMSEEEILNLLAEKSRKPRKRSSHTK